MEKKRNLWVIPTDKPSRLYQKENRFQLSTHPAIDWYISSASYKPVNIYITSDEVIKEGDWCIDKHNVVYKQETDKIFTKFNGTKKIILTTYQDLIKDGVQDIEDEFLEWFVKNPSCEFVEVGYGWIRLTETNNEGYWISIPDNKLELKIEELKHPKVFSENGNQLLFDEQGNLIREQLDYAALLQPVGTRQETLEEAAEIFYSEQSKAYEDATEFMFDNSRYLVAGFIDGAKWKAERMYSKEEVIAIVEKSRETGLTAEYLLLTDQFKKK